MRRLLMMLLLLGSLTVVSAADPAAGRVLKVLPLFLDAQGRDALTPSLYDRDAYQVQLREHPKQRTALRLDVLWRATRVAGEKYKLRVQLRGISTNSLPRRFTLEQEVTPGFFRRWTSLTLGGADYQVFNEVTAWRATLWAGDQMIGEQKSFLW